MKGAGFGETCMFAEPLVKVMRLDTLCLAIMVSRFAVHAPTHMDGHSICVSCM